MGGIIRRRRDYLMGVKLPEHNYSQDYLTFVSLTDNNKFTWINDYKAGYKTISVSTDEGSTWVSYTSSYNNNKGTTIATINKGDKLLIKGNNDSYYTESRNGFGSSGEFNIEGNIMSLVYGDAFVDKYSLYETRTFTGIFMYAKVVDASNLILPATTLTSYCYRAMFAGCSQLETPPKLPATELAIECYSNMFESTAITASPVLPASTLVDRCYFAMFVSCFYINRVDCYAEDISATNCTYAWLSNAPNSGVFVKSASMSSWPSGTSGIPSGWTVENV